MTAIPFMPFYVADYLADTGHLTTAEHGAYMLLLCAYWQKGGPLPNDDKLLARYARMTAPAWKRAKPVVLDFFDVTTSEIIQSRVEHELEHVRDKSLKAKKAGQASAQRRFSKRATDDQLSKMSDTDKEKPLPLLKIEEVGKDWNEMAKRTGLPSVKAFPKSRRTAFRERLREFGPAAFTDAIQAVERSDFCRGKNDRGWRADFDFLLQPKSFVKLLEGAYGHDPPKNGESYSPEKLAALDELRGLDLKPGSMEFSMKREEIYRKHGVS
ncbi:MAG TPA: DUF1376 domain-containing protein [Woeseiaceae bacterium]